MFLNELCNLVEVLRPDPAGPDDEKNAYAFEHADVSSLMYETSALRDRPG